MELRFNKKDVLLLIVVVVCVAVFALFWHFSHQKNGASVKVTVDGTVYGIYELNTDQDIPILIDGVETNHLVIADGEADMISADCPDQICVNEKAASKDGESLVCLPNKVIVTVESDEVSDLDGVAQ